MKKDNGIEKVKAVLAGLTAGDGIYAPLSIQGEEVTIQASVLRREGDLIWVSIGQENSWSNRPYPYNPLKWDESKSALADKDGDVPKWYSVRLSFERGVAQDAVARYEAIPRLDKTPVDELKDEEWDAFVKTPLADIVIGLIHNGEAGHMYTQLALLLNVMDGLSEKDRIAALMFFCEVSIAERVTSGLKKAIAGAIVIGVNCDCEECRDGRNEGTH